MCQLRFLSDGEGGFSTFWAKTHNTTLGAGFLSLSEQCQLSVGAHTACGSCQRGKLFFAANIEICLSVLTIRVTCNSFGSCPSDENGLQTHHRNPRLDGRLSTGPHLLHHYLQLRVSQPSVVVFVIVVASAACPRPVQAGWGILLIRSSVFTPQPAA